MYRKATAGDCAKIYDLMHNFHYKFSKSLVGNDSDVNAIGK